ncbi:MAG: hypothetical protein ACTHN5_08245 [Phycisphaerae bacterium]
MNLKVPAAPDRKLLELKRRQSAAEVQLAELQVQIELALQACGVGGEGRKEGKEKVKGE